MTQTLMKYLLIGTAAPLMALAQVRPVQPVPPVAPVPPAAPVAPVPPVRVHVDPRFDYHYEISPKLDEMRMQLEEARVKLQVEPHIDIALERARFDVERVREMSQFQAERARE